MGQETWEKKERIKEKERRKRGKRKQEKRLLAVRS